MQLTASPEFFIRTFLAATVAAAASVPHTLDIRLPEEEEIISPPAENPRICHVCSHSSSSTEYNTSSCETSNLSIFDGVRCPPGNTVCSTVRQVFANDNCNFGNCTLERGSTSLHSKCGVSNPQQSSPAESNSIPLSEISHLINGCYQCITAVNSSCSDNPEHFSLPCPPGSIACVTRVSTTEAGVAEVVQRRCSTQSQNVVIYGSTMRECIISCHGDYCNNVIPVKYETTTAQTGSTIAQQNESSSTIQSTTSSEVPITEVQNDRTSIQDHTTAGWEIQTTVQIQQQDNTTQGVARIHASLWSIFSAVLIALLVTFSNDSKV
uniref:uncharacterized protein LOC100176642 isoform X2 n=1 Tax=Ciona intestinalis TaxID=7719 RepID=UPI00089DB3EF|nr:uncharacterized protein LOC100176642 isoform X2 [Ciona intestinalis]|eukprot:XP_018672097.1 uncharacterized protein LOC100176642 isoform X2 [Ciona intestinalis]